MALSTRGPSKKIEAEASTDPTARMNRGQGMMTAYTGTSREYNAIGGKTGTVPGAGAGEPTSSAPPCKHAYPRRWPRGSTPPSRSHRLETGATPERGL